MSLEIVIDDLSRDDGPYAQIAAACPHALIYHSVSYGRFLKTMLQTATCEYLVARDGDRPVAALPTFALSHPQHGTVVNSLPFYGSHGSILCLPDAPAGAADALMEAFHARNRAGGVVAATIVGNPEGPAQPPANPQPDLIDRRIGQFTPLPTGTDRSVVEEALFAQYHQKTRNMVRKGLKSDYRFREDTSPAMFAELERMHVDGMRAIGGKWKEPAFFAAVQSTFVAGRDYRLFIAETSEGGVAAMLLMLYHRGYAEYFVPVSDAGHRSNQPLSALIHHAMMTSIVEAGSTCWNWGGTWLSQDGVYRFKSRWGTVDKDYDYKTWLYPENGDVTRLTRTDLADAYPQFFVVPYSALASERAGENDA